MDPLRFESSSNETSFESNRSPNEPTIWGVTEYYYPNFSGAAIQAHRILSQLAASGMRVRMLTVADQAASGHASHSLRLDGVEITYLPVVRQRAWSTWRWLPPPVRKGAASLNQSMRDWSFQRSLIRTLRRHARSGDVVQLYVVGDWTWLLLRTAQQLGLRVIIQISLVGADDPSSFQRSWLGVSTWLKKQCFFRVERIIGLSRALTRSCHDAGIPPDRVVRIPNGVDLEQFPSQNPELRRVHCLRLGYDPQRLRLVFVGSAILRKGIDVAIGAFQQLAREIPKVDLLIVGPCDFSDRTRHDAQRDACLQKLRTELQEDQLSNRVVWVGQVENVSDYLLASDIFFFPTRREGLPNALAEAMACGLPVVASNLEGITTDLVEDGREGYLVRGHSPENYVVPLRKLCQDSSQRSTMGIAARQRIEREFELQTVVAQYVDLYKPPSPRH